MDSFIGVHLYRFKNNDIERGLAVEYKSFPFEVKSFDEAGFAGYAATFGVLDRVADLIVPGAFRETLPTFLKEGIIAWQHDWKEPIGKPIEAFEDQNGLFVKAVLSETQRGRDVRTLLQDGVIRKLSIGYEVLEAEEDVSIEQVQGILKRELSDEEQYAASRYPIRILKRIKLFEVSPVSVPANPAAVITQVKQVKAVTGYRGNLPLAPRDRPWDKTAAERRVRAWAGAEEAPNERYRNAFFWYDAENPENFGSYKLLYCDVIDGKLHAVPRAIFAVAAVLQGARGGVDIPESDKARIRSIVSRWYARMRQEFDDDSIVPPWEERRGLEQSPFLQLTYRSLSHRQWWMKEVYER